MNITGIVVEYNPLHNGHLKHLKETREITNCDVLIAVMTGYFNQRGTISIMDKKEKIESALNHGVDLIIELPINYVLSSADIYAKGAIDCLNLCGVNNIVFGSETNNIEELQTIADLNINVNHLKENLKAGLSFPKSYGLLAGNFEANDILGISYLKAIKDKNITPYTIKRNVSYHAEEINEITSASAIRKAIKNKKDYTIATPIRINDPRFNDEYFNYLQTLLSINDLNNIKNIYLVNEGIENHLIKCIKDSKNYDDFINKATTRRYTKARIERTLINIMMNNTKNEITKLKKPNFVRVLGFNQKGQNYLKHLKEKINVAVNYNQIPKDYRTLFYKSALLYAHGLSFEKRQLILKQEISGPIIKK